MARLLSAVLDRRAGVRELSAAHQLALLLLLHVLLWTWVGVSSRSNFDSPGDMVEAYAWSQGWQWGYYKHPPLSAWVTGLWFAVVPESHWGFSLLAAVNGALGLLGLAFLAREFLPRHWVLLVVALASLTPGLSALAMRFNANAILVSTWPWAMALFVRLMQRGRPLDALLCGLACALALLGKYYSAVLLLTLLCAALWLPAWRRRVATPAFALAVATFAVCLAPHVAWLAAQSAGPLHYAQGAAGVESTAPAMLRAVQFALAQLAFPAVALVALRYALVGPLAWRGFRQALIAPVASRGEVVWLLAALPIVATVLATALTGARTAAVWGLPISAGLTLLLASRAHGAGALVDLRRLWRVLATIWLAVAALAPAWWLLRAHEQSPVAAEPREELALELDALWRGEFDAPLRWVSGTRALAASTAFYAPGHPGYWSLWDKSAETPWVDTDDVRSDGGLIICARDDETCDSLARSWSVDERLVTVAKSRWGKQFPARTFRVFVIPPSIAAEP
jgi:4-amino-4-deoxy-L-arabinose transferase-like glycosyltransferase